ncbi:MAG TPA: prepilin peptidase [Stellaceae bacterium]|nr:prepilin peptidase [Stellaceae bacterium]
MFHVLPDQFLVFCFLALLAWAACSDAVEFEIPNSVSLGIAALYPLYVLAAPNPVQWIWGVAVACATLALGFALFAKGYFGGGDIKMVSAAALWAGPKLILPMLFVISIAGGALALLFLAFHWMQRRRATAGVDASLTAGAYAARARLPYGVAIAIGAGLVGLRLLAS